RRGCCRCCCWRSHCRHSPARRATGPSSIPGHAIALGSSQRILEGEHLPELDRKRKPTSPRSCASVRAGVQPGPPCARQSGARPGACMRHVLVGMMLAIPAVARAAPAVWVTHATVKIQPGDAPGTSTSASISAAQNEFEAFQVAVKGGASGATGISVNAPTLIGPGGASIPAANVRLYLEALITTTYASNQEVSP